MASTVLSTVTAHLALALYLQGSYEEAERFAKETEKLAPAEDKESQILWRATTARVMAKKGEATGEAERLAPGGHAEALARQAVELAQETDFPITQAGALVALADVLHEQGRATEAADAFRRAIALYEAKGDVVEGRRAREMLERLEPDKQPAKT